MPESNAEVSMVELGPMRVASVRALGTTPEHDAWARMKAWAAAKGLLDLKRNPVFGFNNPDPAPGQAFHGYEYWMRVDEGIPLGQGVDERRFEGGAYAVAVCRVNDPWKDIPPAWGRLLKWAQENGYAIGTHQYFEVPEDPDVPDSKLVLHLYLPVIKK